ncbi:hypothetical protein RsTz2092_09480 [Deferribacterales bacterium RsTz2092]|nr:hypothetical protein AGMMS49941_07180 [Deferribacterales bacterium]
MTETTQNEKFVFAKRDIQADDVILPKNLIGIVKEHSKDYVLVHFMAVNKQAKVSKNDIGFFNPVQTGDLHDKKVCNVCHKLLGIENFQKNQNQKDNRAIMRPSCRDCRKVIDGAPLRTEDKKVWGTKKPHLEAFQCPICKKVTIPGLTSKVVLDHNHETGKARAWICDSCNTGLGRFKDDIALLKSAIEYIKSK